MNWDVQKLKNLLPKQVLIWFSFFYLRIISFIHSLHKDMNFSERKTQYIIIIIIIIIINYSLVCEQTICFIVLEAKI